MKAESAPFLTLDAFEIDRVKQRYILFSQLQIDFNPILKHLVTGIWAAVL